MPASRIRSSTSRELVTRRADAGEVRHRRDPELLAGSRTTMSTVLSRGRAAGAVGDRHERRGRACAASAIVSSSARSPSRSSAGRTRTRSRAGDVAIGALTFTRGSVRGLRRRRPSPPLAAYSPMSPDRPRNPIASRRGHRRRVHHDAAIAAHAGGLVAVGPREVVLRAADAVARRDRHRRPGMSAIPASWTAIRTRSGPAPGSTSSTAARRASRMSRSRPAGGGIKATVAAVRAASEGELVAAATRRLARMRALGTTTAEVKSGYGLDAVSEATMLRAAHAAGAAADVRSRAPVSRCTHCRPRPPLRTRSCALAIDEILPACAGSRPPPTASSSAARSPPTSAARTSSRRATAASRCGSTATSSPSAARSRSPSSSARRPSTTSSRPGPRTCRPARLLAASPHACLPLLPLYLDLRCRPPAPSPTPARGSCSRPLQPSSAPSESMRMIMNLACTSGGCPARRRSRRGATAHVALAGNRLALLHPDSRRRHRCCLETRTGDRLLYLGDGGPRLPRVGLAGTRVARPGAGASLRREFTSTVGDRVRGGRRARATPAAA